MVLLILAVIWAVVLIPPLLRARAENSPVDSIVDFHRQLRVLQRTRPVVERRVGAVVAPQAVAPEAVASQAVASQAVASQATLPRPGRQPGSAYAPSARRRPPAARRVRAARRRRDVMFSLLMAVGTTFVVATVLSVTALWVLHVVTDVLLFAYVALLVRMRNVSAEREMKLRFLPPQTRPQPQPALLLRRSAN